MGEREGCKLVGSRLAGWQVYNKLIVHWYPIAMEIVEKINNNGMSQSEIVVM